MNFLILISILLLGSVSCFKLTPKIRINHALFSTPTEISIEGYIKKATELHVLKTNQVTLDLIKDKFDTMTTKIENMERSMNSKMDSQRWWERLVQFLITIFAEYIFLNTFGVSFLSILKVKHAVPSL